MHLDALKPGQSAIIDRIHAEQALAQRLNALGFRAGKQLEVIRQAVFNGPLHVRIGSTDVIIRLEDAKAIHLHPTPAHQTESNPV
ncbi:FeoA family protein [Methylophilus medardicus]|uniref:Ferrous iron transport protein A n=1 Tax=Methylophilus medardicus TaxID=2588534 RepID=A0A5B8CR24_9PROT|nr:FeoA family protein [Methylophilus medardicus]QDC43697.1 ferrous iron transport protein A [Methylophilus medardicus]QDC48704.1 ferrous iron transport protein A [Methylophilus medardicus]QDC52409.1 ferrous iron transport protein A [Methylophilus medardicus]